MRVGNLSEIPRPDTIVRAWRYSKTPDQKKSATPRKEEMAENKLAGDFRLPEQGRLVQDQMLGAAASESQAQETKAEESEGTWLRDGHSVQHQIVDIKC